MLVLSRNPDERIVLVLPDGRRVTVLYANIHGQQIRLGIEAPSDVRIYRGEIMSKIDAEMGRGDRDGRSSP
jgi:carbon storage regulator